MSTNANKIKLAQGALQAHHRKLEIAIKYNNGSPGQIRSQIAAMEARLRELEAA